jgi:hypothetical protein
MGLHIQSVSLGSAQLLMDLTFSQIKGALHIKEVLEMITFSFQNRLLLNAMGSITPFTELKKLLTTPTQTT